MTSRRRIAEVLTPLALVAIMVSVIDSAPARAAAAVGGPPRIAIETTCRSGEKEIIKLFGETTMATYDGCMKQESDAFGQLTANWASYSASDKALCVQTNVFMPSYVEWHTCLEIQRDLKRIRKNEAETARPARNTPSRKR